MNFSKHNSEAIQKNKHKPTKSQKHETKLKTNSTIYFQVGLIICLLFSYGLLEASFKTKEINIPKFPELEEDDSFVYNVPIIIYKEPTEIEQKKRKPVVFSNPIISDDDSVIEPIDLFLEPSTTEPLIDPSKIIIIDVPEYVPPMNIMAVEQVPIFPGCEDASSNEARRQCMSEKIATHIQKKFNTDIASSLGLSGEQKIYVTFKINKTGHVTDIKTSSKYSQLNKESERVLEILPQMTPAKQKDKNVEVLYGLPIKFNILN